MRVVQRIRKTLSSASTMNMYWVLTIVVMVAIGLAGLYATRRWVQPVHGERHSHNEVVTAYLGAVCVFYGITLGSFEGAWRNRDGKGPNL
jgi:hypothetical protein